MDRWRALFAIAAGLFSIFGAALEWSFFMESGKAKGMIRLLGYNGTRVFYVAIGVLLVVLGGAMASGALPGGR